MEKKDDTGAVRVGMVWGGIGGVIGFLVSLLGSLAGIFAAGFVGFSCGRRAAVADAGKRSGALSGLVGGSLAAPLFMMGAAAGALVTARQIGSEQMAATLSEFVQMEVSAREAWNLYVVGIVFAAVIQAAVLIGTSTAAGAWTTRRK